MNRPIITLKKITRRKKISFTEVRKVVDYLVLFRQFIAT